MLLCLLKRLRLIRNPVVYRESTAVLSHCTWFWKRAIGLLIRHADGLIVQSPQTLADLAALFPVRQPVAVVRNPCDFAGRPPSSAFSSRSGTAGDPLRLLVIGRLEPMKGHARLLRALASAGMPPWRLTIAGDGSLAASLQAEVAALGLASQVELAGLVRDVRPLYEACDLVVIPSFYEGLPNVLVEALACGRRVLVAEGRGGAPEFMRDLGLGAFLVPETSFAGGLAERVSEAMASPAAIWQSAYARLLVQVHPDAVADRVWRFLEECRV